MPLPQPYPTDELEQLVAAQLLPALVGQGLVEQMTNAPSAADVSVCYLGSTQNSHSYLAESRLLERPVFLKQTSAEMVAEECRSLSILADKNHSDRFRTPQLVGRFDDHNILCLEYIDGENLLPEICRATRSTATITAAVEEAGRWLANYHSLSQIPRAPLPIDSRLDFLNQQLQPVIEQLESDSLLRVCRDWIWSNAETVSNVSITHGMTHGDCKPENFMLTGRNIIGLDFSAERPGPQLTDVAQFVSHLRFLRMRPGAVLAWPHIERWISAYVGAYCEAGGYAPELVLRWLDTSHLLRFWANERARGSLPGVVQARLIRREIARLMR